LFDILRHARESDGSGRAHESAAQLRAVGAGADSATAAAEGGGRLAQIRPVSELQFLIKKTKNLLKNLLKNLFFWL
jgi:hypothetical protein